MATERSYLFLAGPLAEDPCQPALKWCWLGHVIVLGSLSFRPGTWSPDGMEAMSPGTLLFSGRGGTDQSDLLHMSHTHTCTQSRM